MSVLARCHKRKMVNFKLGEEMNDVINMSRAMGQRKKSESPYTG